MPAPNAQPLRRSDSPDRPEGDTVIAVVVLLGGFLAATSSRMPAGLQGFLEIRLTIKNLLLVLGLRRGMADDLCPRAGSTMKRIGDRQAGGERDLRGGDGGLRCLAS